ncbi:hypothetical protein J7K60_05455 [Candidatus Bipolaricaulota bacterium]|nr:hypothetical protein [Candidatus Bipolaricaulota bacterium]
MAVLAGFRIESITDPSGGFIHLAQPAIPVTILWVVQMLRLLEGIRQAAPEGFSRSIASSHFLRHKTE